MAVDEMLERKVAVKVLTERYAADEEIRRRFTREALAAARLSAQRHVVTIYDVGEHAGQPFIVMAYMAGGSLDRRLANGRATPSEALTWLEHAAVALDAAHALGIVHRDVKPGNLLLDANDVVHVGDFGIARAAGLDSLTSPGTILGTAGYLSPEQAQGAPATAASDRYGLGVVAFELLTGRRPFVAETPTAEALAHANASPPRVGEVDPDLPNALDDVFSRALAKQPGDRPASCASLVADLRAAFWHAETATLVHALPPEPETTVRAPSVQTSRTRVHRPARRRPALRLYAVGVLALALAGAGVAIGTSVFGGGSGGTVTRVVERTVREQGAVNTVTQTVTTATTATPSTERTSASALNDAGYQRLRAGDAQGALSLLERAVAGLQGSGSLAEAYASYNLAWARFALGRCDGVIELLDRSEQVQGRRKEIDKLRKQAEHRCRRGANGNGGGGDGEG